MTRFVSHWWHDLKVAGKKERATLCVCLFEGFNASEGLAFSDSDFGLYVIISRVYSEPIDYIKHLKWW